MARVPLCTVLGACPLTMPRSLCARALLRPQHTPAARGPQHAVAGTNSMARIVLRCNVRPTGCRVTVPGSCSESAAAGSRALPAAAECLLRTAPRESFFVLDVNLHCTIAQLKQITPFETVPNATLLVYGLARFYSAFLIIDYMQALKIRPSVAGGGATAHAHGRGRGGGGRCCGRCAAAAATSPIAPPAVPRVPVPLRRPRAPAAAAASQQRAVGAPRRPPACQQGRCRAGPAYGPGAADGSEGEEEDAPLEELSKVCRHSHPPCI
jgi:hypothetical protein